MRRQVGVAICHRPRHHQGRIESGGRRCALFRRPPCARTVSTVKSSPPGGAAACCDLASLCAARVAAKLAAEPGLGRFHKASFSLHAACDAEHEAQDLASNVAGQDDGHNAVGGVFGQTNAASMSKSQIKRRKKKVRNVAC